MDVLREAPPLSHSPRAFAHQTRQLPALEILGAVIVENAAMKVTRQFIMDNRTARGSWTRPQIEALGIEWPPTQGWVDRVIGLELTPEQAHQFKVSNVPRNKAAAVNKDQLGLF